MKKFLLTLAALVVATLAFAAPAFAWHVVSAQAECVEGYVTAITVDLSDAGAGTYSDSLGNSGSFTDEPFTYNAGPTDEGSVIVTIDQQGAETLQVIEVHVDECKAPPVTTTIPPTTTTVPPVTTTVPPYVAPPPSIPAPPAPPAAPVVPELPHTGASGGLLLILGIAGGVIAMIGYGAVREGRRLAPAFPHNERLSAIEAGEEAADPRWPAWDIRNLGWKRSIYKDQGY